MAKNLMTVVCVLAIFLIQTIICQKISPSSHLQADLSHSQNANFAGPTEFNRLLSIVSIDQEDSKTSNGEGSVQNPFIGDANQANQQGKGIGVSIFSNKRRYKLQSIANNGVFYNTGSNQGYRDLNGNTITNLMQIVGMCSGFSNNQNNIFSLQFLPNKPTIQPFSVPLQAGTYDNDGFYQTWVPLGDFIFPFAQYNLAVNGWCGTDPIGPRLNSTSTGFKIQ